MKTWSVTDARWANAGDLGLPFWRDWNAKYNLPKSFWQRIWEYPYVASRVPGRAPSLDVGGTYPFVLFDAWPGARSVDNRDLNELDHKLHRGLWTPEKLLISDATALPLEDNAVPYSFSVSAIEEMPEPIAVLEEMLRVAAHRVVITMDVSDLLGIPMRQIRELEDFIGQRLPPIPADVLTSTSPILRKFGQRSNSEYEAIRVLGLTFDARDEPRTVTTLVPADDPGRQLDEALPGVTTQYVAMVDPATAAPGSVELGIQALEDHLCTAAGRDVGSSARYRARSSTPWWQPAEGYEPGPGRYDNDWFVCLENDLRVMPTAVAQVVSEQIGFAARAAGTERRGRRSAYLDGVPAGVAADHFIDVNRLGPKFVMENGSAEGR